LRGGQRVEEAERRRREFIRAHHPDRGGDPDAFVFGLRSLDTDPPEPLPRVVVVRRRAWLARLVSTVITRLRPDSRAPRVR